MWSSHARPQPTLKSWATGERAGAGAGSHIREVLRPAVVGSGEAICHCLPTLIPLCAASCPRWAKGGFLIEDAHESRYETNVDYSFFTEPVSCEVHNKVGSTNVSTLVNVHCE